jgi:hypothetical protein
MEFAKQVLCTPIAIYKMYVDVISICVQSVALLLARVRFQPGWCVFLEEQLRQGIFVEIVLCVLRFQYPTIC